RGAPTGDPASGRDGDKVRGWSGRTANCFRNGIGTAATRGDIGRNQSPKRIDCRPTRDGKNGVGQGIGATEAGLWICSYAVLVDKRGATHERTDWIRHVAGALPGDVSGNLQIPCDTALEQSGRIAGSGQSQARRAECWKFSAPVDCAGRSA